MTKAVEDVVGHRMVLPPVPHRKSHPIGRRAMIGRSRRSLTMKLHAAIDAIGLPIRIE